tara:strand:- start:1515 stop:1670 length:156 start_codon:yes stop_codon:yes gene_type:complete
MDNKDTINTTQNNNKNRLTEYFIREFQNKINVIKHIKETQIDMDDYLKNKK